MEDVAKIYTQYVIKTSQLDALSWMYLDADGDLMIGVDHYLASPETSRGDLEDAIQGLWMFGFGPRQIDDPDFAGQTFGMQLRTRRAPIFTGIPASDLLHPEMTGDPARYMTRNDPDIFSLSAWQEMTDEAEEMFDLPFGPSIDTDYYQDCSTFRLDRGAIVQMFLADVRGVINELLGRVVVDGAMVSDFQGFNAYPLDAQLAVLDLAYEIGAARLARFSAFRMAVGRGEWSAAAERCPIVGDADQMRWRREQFMKAAAATASVTKAATIKPQVTSKPPIR